MTKRFAYFAGGRQTTEGGWNDCLETFETLDIAIAYAKMWDQSPREWAHIVDLKTGKIVHQWDGQQWIPVTKSP